MFGGFRSHVRRITQEMFISWHSFLVYKLREIMVAGVGLAGIIIFLGWMSFREVKQVVTEDFNGQQLLLARYAARQINHLLDLFRREITLLSLSPSLQYYEKVAIGRRLGFTFSSIQYEGAIEVRFLDADGNHMHLVAAGGYRESPALHEDQPHRMWARDPANQGLVFISEVFSDPVPGGKERLLMKIVTPVWQVSADESHPVPTNRYAGLLICVVDVTLLVSKPARDVRSGKSGYAWVIDGQGTFLYHPEQDFVGRNAFEARRQKMPTISFDRINEIQKTLMVTGKEGMSWYVSGWHRGREGSMEKLIAYSPILLQDNDRGPFWSVAVVAPVTEVEGAIRAIQFRGFFLQAMIMAWFALGTMAILTLSVRWSALLKQEVDKRTAELKKSEQRYRSLVESADDIIFTVNRGGMVLSMNACGVRIFRRPPEAIVGRNLSELFTPPTAQEPLLAIEEVFEQKKGRQITHLVKLGEREHWLNTSFRRLFDESGNIYAILGISRDITDRKVMEEQSYHTEKLASLGTLAAGVAHEINNPLTVILGFTDLMLEKAAPDSEAQDILKTVQNYGQKAKKVVDNLLAFARRKEQSEGEVDINQCLTAVLAVLGNIFLVHKIAVERLELAPGLPPVKGDADELQQVFFNIINNAIYAMKGGGKLSIVTTTAENSTLVVVQISDTGGGIPREHRSRIFDPLFTTKRVGDGTGLGLSVSYGIIARHHGTISFETFTREESERTGTIFFITLPAVPRETGRG